MANDCSNWIQIKGDKDLIKLFIDSYLVKNERGDYGLDFNHITPIPKDCDNDYVFRIDNWGDKWDGTNGEVYLYSDDEICISVDTAWSPCEPIVKKLISLCPALYFYHEYYEPGCGFVGWIEHQDYEGPDDYEQVDYTHSDGVDYWWTIFQKEFESYDWLSEIIDDALEYEEITKEDHEELRSIFDQEYFGTDEEYLLIQLCCEKGVLQ